jgi:hypothetical protein
MNMFFQVFISITQFIIRDSAYIKLVLWIMLDQIG